MMNVQRLSIRVAKAENAAEIAHVHVEAWRSAYRDLLPAELLANMSVERRRHYWDQTLSNPNSELSTFVALQGERLVGFVIVGPGRDIEPVQNWGELMAIYLLEESWGQGAGWCLWEAGKGALVAAGYRAVILWVLDGNQRAIEFYEKIGFVRDQSSQGTKIEQLGGVTVREHRYIYETIG